MFNMFKKREYQAEPVQIYSLQDAIQDYERRKNQIEVLKFSVADMARKYPTCHICLLNHPVYKKNAYVLQQEKKEQKKIDKMKEFERKVLSRINGEEATDREC